MPTKERPILFSAPMVRAILEGRKTQTRRVLSSVIGRGRLTEVQGSTTPEYDIQARDRMGLWNDFKAGEIISRCPYGNPGDLLWVRETWCHYGAGDAHVGYKATDSISEDAFDRWRPSIHMPRWASRLTLRITDVRVERLQSISEEDAITEGFARLVCSLCNGQIQGCRCGDGHCMYQSSYREWYRDLWESINGPDSWDANPWVWVIEFKRVEVSQ